MCPYTHNYKIIVVFLKKEKEKEEEEDNHCYNKIYFKFTHINHIYTRYIYLTNFLFLH